MRLSKQQAARATEELLTMLTNNPHGLRTSEMVGTPRFHGAKTLTNRTVIRLLRASGRASEYIGGFGNRTFLVWELK